MGPIPPIPRIIPVLSGKGGVGKSSTTVQLALALCLRSHSVAVLDIDLTGPSIPRLFGIEKEKIRQAPGGWMPVRVQEPFSLTEDESGNGNGSGVKGVTGIDGGEAGPRRLGGIWCMSLGFLLKDRGDAVVWRGPKKTAMVKQLLSDVLWPEGIDYLLIDTPPGTSDEHISLATQLLDPLSTSSSSSSSSSQPTPTQQPISQRLGAVIVTTPQAISTSDVKKELSFCEKTQLPVLGVVENMAGYVCPCCGEVTNVFSKGGGQVMAREWGVEFFGSVPVDGEGWGMLVEEGRRPVYRVPGETSGLTGNGRVAKGGGNAEGNEEGDEDSDGMGNGEKAAAKVAVASVPDPGTLAEKYTSCSLFPIFDGFAERIEAFEVALPKPPAG